MTYAPVNIYSVTDALDLQSDFLSFFVCLDSGEVILLTEEEKRGISPSPASYTEISVCVDTIAMLHSFCKLLGEEPYRYLEPYINEENVDFLFSFFQQYQVEEEWSLHREEQLQQLAISWCNEKGIPYVQEERED